MRKIKNKLEIASHIAVILGIPFFLIQQMFGSWQTQRSETLAYVKLFQEARMVDAREVLQAPWRRLNLPKIAQAGATAENLDKIIFLEVENSENLRSAIFEMTDFYDSLGVCIENHVCEQKLASNYFSSYGNNFWCIYGGYLVRIRTEFGLIGFGEFAERFVISRKNCFSSN